MSQIKIDCPACGARGKIKAVSTKCSYCKGNKTVKLTYHLKQIGHLEALKNVEDFQHRMETNTPK
jgi:DnaJ-class molecular chaperone